MKQFVKKFRTLCVCAVLTLSLTLAAVVANFGMLTPKAASTVITTNVAQQYQKWDGWGTTLAWWANEIGDWTRPSADGTTQREYIMELLFGESGLDFNIARYNVGGGDDPSHEHMTFDRNMPGFKAGLDEPYAWEIEDGTTRSWEELPDARQLWVLDWIIDHRGKKGSDDLITEFFSNSPPYWMTQSGCASGFEGGGENLHKNTEDVNYREEFADYLLDVWQYIEGQFAEDDFHFNYLQPYNESTSKFWKLNGSQEGCDFSINDKIEILSLLRKKIEERGIDQNPEYLGYNYSDETNTSTAVNVFNQTWNSSYTSSTGLTGKDIIRDAAKLTYHIYGYEKGNAQTMYRNAKSNGLKVEMSEICFTEGDEHDTEDMATAFAYTNSIVNTIKDGVVEAYIFWQGVEDKVGQMLGGTNYGLLQGIYYTQEDALSQGVDIASMGLSYQDVTTCKAYYGSGQYTKYIKPGYRIVEIDDGQSLAAVSPEGDKLVIVRQNQGSEESNTQYDLDGFRATNITKIWTDATHDWATEAIPYTGHAFVDTVSPNSVTTYVIEGVSEVGGVSAYYDNTEFSYTDQPRNTLFNIINSNKGKETETRLIGFNGNDAKEGDKGGSTWYTNDSSKYVAMSFYGTGLEVLARVKSDSGSIKIWIDPASASALDGTPTATVQLTQSDTEYHKLVYRNNTLERGWHTVMIAPESWFNFDGLAVIDGADAPAASEVPTVASASGKDGKLYVLFDKGGLSDYECKLEYRPLGGAWKRVDAAAQDDVLTVEPAESEGAAFEVRVVAIKGNDERVSDSQPAYLLPATSDVLYYVDCGTSDFTDGLAGRVLGSLNSVFDRPFGKDPQSGLAWGYDNLSTGARNYYGGDDAVSSLASGDGFADAKIVYKFTIPEAGTYKMAVVGYNPWGERNLTLKLDGTGVTAVDDTLTVGQNGASQKILTLTTTQANAVATLTVNASGKDAATLSLITIAAADANPIPLYADYVSDYAAVGKTDFGSISLGKNFVEEIGKAEFKVTMSDGTEKTLKVGSGLAVEELGLKELVAGETLSVRLKTTGESWTWSPMTFDLATTTMQEGRVLYYNIDAGSDGSVYGSAFPAGTKQTGGKWDQQYSASDPNGWGYTDSSSGTFWANENAESSIREFGSGQHYVMTKFDPNEKLVVEVVFNLHDWGGTRTIQSITVNNTTPGATNIVIDGSHRVARSSFKATADGEGKLRLTFNTVGSAKVVLASIKVYCETKEDPSLNTATPGAIASDKTAYVRGTDKIALSGLETEGMTYVLDDKDRLIDEFKPTAASMEWDKWDLVPADAAGLRFTQSFNASDTGSAELTVDLPGLDIVFDKAYVDADEVVVVRFRPMIAYGSLQTLSLTYPDGVVRNIGESFFLRAPRNGTYTATMVASGITVEQQFVIGNIDVVSLNAVYSKDTWTSENVTVTLTPSAPSGIALIEVDGTPQELTDGKLVLTATENKVFSVKVTTVAGFVQTFEVKVANIDTTPVDFTATFDPTHNGGVRLTYTPAGIAESVLKVKQGDGEAQTVVDAEEVILTAAGKYELWLETEIGSSAHKIWYVTYDAAKAVLGAVTVADDGAITAPAGAKLYKAGSAAALASLKLTDSGTYFLLTEKDGETEVVVLRHNMTEKAPVTTGSADTGSSKKGCGNSAVGSAFALAVLLAGVALVSVAAKRRAH